VVSLPRVLKAIVVVVFVGLALTPTTAVPGRPTVAAVQAASGPSRGDLLRHLAGLPLQFQPNLGQTDSRVRFLARGAGYTVFLTPGEIVLTFGGGPNHHASVLRLRALGANPHPDFGGLSLQHGKISYFSGKNAQSWHTNIPTYGRVLERGVYPGIDLVFYGRGNRLEYDWLVHPGADVGRITLRLDDAASLRLNRAGELVMTSRVDAVVQGRPRAFQQQSWGKRHITAAYRLSEDGTVRLAVGPYDHKLPLVIDPTIQYSTYLGGSSLESGETVAVDATGSVYVAGFTQSTDFPTQHSLYASPGGFVTKFSPTGDALEYSSFFTGGEPTSIALDPSGDVVFAGTGDITTPQLHQIPGAAPYSTVRNASNAFLARLHWDAASQSLSLVYSTLLGSNSQGQAIALDPAGNVYMTELNRGDYFPLVHPIATYHGASFAVRVDWDAANQSLALVYSTPLDGYHTWAIAVDQYSNAYLFGYIRAGDPFTSTDGSTPHGGSDVFVTKLSFDGINTLTAPYSTVIGGSGDESPGGIAVDEGGNVYLSGTTNSSDFPTLKAVQPRSAGGDDGFVVQLDPNGVPLVSTYLGGSTYDEVEGVAIGNTSGVGNQCEGPCDVYISGQTDSPDYPSVNPVQPNQVSCGTEATITRLNLSAGIVFSTTLGGCYPPGYTAYARGESIAVDAAGDIALVGTTFDHFPTYHAVQPTFGGGGDDAFVVKITNSGTTAARVIHATLYRHQGHITFTWQLARSTNVVSFALYARSHRLNSRMIPMHASRTYQYVVAHPGPGPYTLHLVLSRGTEVVIPLD